MTTEEHHKAFHDIESSLEVLEWIQALPPRQKPRQPINYAPPMGMHEVIVGRWIYDDTDKPTLKRPI